MVIVIHYGGCKTLRRWVQNTTAGSLKHLVFLGGGGGIHRKSPQIVNHYGDGKLLRRSIFSTAGSFGCFGFQKDRLCAFSCPLEEFTQTGGFPKDPAMLKTLRDGELLRCSVFTTPPPPDLLRCERFFERKKCRQFPGKWYSHPVRRDSKSLCDSKFTT